MFICHITVFRPFSYSLYILCFLIFSIFFCFSFNVRCTFWLWLNCVREYIAMHSMEWVLRFVFRYDACLWSKYVLQWVPVIFGWLHKTCISVSLEMKYFDGKSFLFITLYFALILCIQFSLMFFLSLYSFYHCHWIEKYSKIFIHNRKRKRNVQFILPVIQ